MMEGALLFIVALAVEENDIESPYLNLHTIIWVHATLPATIESYERCWKKIIIGNSYLRSKTNNEEQYEWKS